MSNKGKRYTVVGTDIEEVKRRNAQAGMSFNEVLNQLASDPQKVRAEIAQEAGPFPSGGGASTGKTVVGTDIAEVKRQNAQSGTGFNEVLSEFATDPQKVRAEIAQEAGPFPSGGGASAGKTVVGTDIAEVERQNNQASKKS